MSQRFGLPSRQQCEVLLNFVQTGQAQLSSFGEAYQVADQEAIYSYGEPVTHLYLVQDGRVRTSTMSTEGRELVTGIHNPGGMFGQFCLCQQHHRNEQALAIAESEIIRIGVNEIIDLAATRDGALSMLQLFCHRISALEEQIAQLAFAKVRTRLALLLLQLAADGDLQADGSCLCTGPTHEEMASRINTTREQVTSLLAQFRQAGYVNYQRGRPLQIFPARLRQDLTDI